MKLSQRTDSREGAIDRVKWFVHRHVRIFTFLGAVMFFSVFAMSSISNSLFGPDQVLRELAVFALMMTLLCVAIFAVNMGWAAHMGDYDEW